LFATPSGKGGVTYDATDGSFWLSDDRGSGVSQYSATGTLLGSFATPEVTSIDWNLALDLTDNTLWMSQAFGGAVLHQYGKDGTYLRALDMSGVIPNAAAFFSAEFDLSQGPVQDTPEPDTPERGTPERGTLALLGAGLVALAAARRRQVG